MGPESLQLDPSPYLTLALAAIKLKRHAERVIRIPGQNLMLRPEVLRQPRGDIRFVQQRVPRVLLMEQAKYSRAGLVHQLRLVPLVP